MKFCYFSVFFIGLFCVTNIAYASTETLRVYANPGDAYVTTSPYPGSWLEQRADSEGRIVTTNQVNQSRVHAGAFQTSSGFLTIERSFLSFDTSSIPDMADLKDVSLNLYVAGKADDFDDQYGYVAVLEGFQQSTSSIIAADIDDCGDSLDDPAVGSQLIDVSDIEVDEYEVIPLNHAGIGWVNVNDVTKLCIREGHDIENQETINNDSSWKSSIVRFFTSDVPELSQRPYLEITYELPDEPEPDERPWLQTQIQSPYPSVAETTEWADDLYAGASTSSSYWCGSTVAGCGCVITSLAMATRDKGIETGVDGSEVSPGNLNSWLQDNEGYTSGGSVIWSRAADYFGTFTDEDEEEIETPVTLVDHRESSTTLITAAVNDDDTFALAFSQTYGHFFVLNEVLTNGYGIWDPLWYNTVTTNDAKNVASSTQDYNDAIARAVIYGVEEAEVQAGLVEATADSPVELLLRDTDSGQETGMSESGVVEGIPASGYTNDDFIGGPRAEETNDRPDHLAKKLIVTEASDEYLLRVTGTDDGSYILTISLYTPEGEYRLVEFMSDTTPGEVAYYLINVTTGEVEEVDGPRVEALDREAFLAIVQAAVEGERKHVQRFFIKLANKIFDKYEVDRIRHAKVKLRIFKKLVRFARIHDDALDTAMQQLKEQLQDEQRS